MAAKPTLKTLPAHLQARVVEQPPRKPTANRSRIHDPPRAAPDTQAPGEVPVAGRKQMQFRYAAATAPFYQQTGRFRIVVEGPVDEQQAVEHALNTLKQ